jgi:hypothetical protein
MNPIHDSVYDTIEDAAPSVETDYCSRCSRAHAMVVIVGRKRTPKILCGVCIAELRAESKIGRLHTRKMAAIRRQRNNDETTSQPASVRGESGRGV